MICKEVKILLYEFIQKTLRESDQMDVEEHLRECKNCKLEKERISQILTLLDTVKIPNLSPQFVENTIQKIQKIPQPLRPLPQGIKKWAKLNYIKWPLRGIAAAAMIFLVFTIFYQGFLSVIEKPKKTIKKIIIPTKVSDAKVPILIETEDLLREYSKLLNIIQAHHGFLIRRKNIEKGIELRVKIDKEREGEFFKDINQLGKVKQAKEGYRDGDANIVIILKKLDKN